MATQPIGSAEMVRRTWFGLAVALGLSTATALVALGLPAESAGASTKHQRIDATFIVEANAVCRTAAIDYDSHGNFPYSSFDPLKPKRSQLPKVGQYYAIDIPSDRNVNSNFVALGEPTSGAKSWNRIRSLIIEFNDNAITQARDAEKSKVKAFVATVKLAGQIDDKLLPLAKVAGFTKSSACMDIF